MYFCKVKPRSTLYRPPPLSLPLFSLKCRYKVGIIVFFPDIFSLMNKLMPGCIKKIDKKGGGFALMQNIERFQEAAKKYGVPVNEVFQTVDLWERKNIPQVTLCIHALGRVVSTPDVLQIILISLCAHAHGRVVSVLKMILVVEHEVQTCIPFSRHLLV